jgi:hypothetical protein
LAGCCECGDEPSVSGATELDRCHCALKELTSSLLSVTRVALVIFSSFILSCCVSVSTVVTSWVGCTTIENAAGGFHLLKLKIRVPIVCPKLTYNHEKDI